MRSVLKGIQAKVEGCPDGGAGEAGQCFLHCLCTQCLVLLIVLILSFLWKEACRKILQHDKLRVLLQLLVCCMHWLDACNMHPAMVFTLFAILLMFYYAIMMIHLGFPGDASHISQGTRQLHIPNEFFVTSN